MTTNRLDTFRKMLNDGTLNILDVAMRKLRLGSRLTPLKVVATGLTAAASFNITTIDMTKCVVTPKVGGAALGTAFPTDGTFILPPIGPVRSLRVVASGTAGSVGCYIVGDAGATPCVPNAANTQPGVASLSDDGKTLTFPNMITAFTLIYEGEVEVDMNSLVQPVSA